MIHLIEINRMSPKEASDLTWNLLQERPAEANISHDGTTTREQHDRFVRNHPYRTWHAIFNNYGQAVGTVLLTQHNEVGVAILRAHQRKGYARAAIEALMRTHDPAPGIPGQRVCGFLANVAPTNAASIALFSKFGKVIQWTYRL